MSRRLFLILAVATAPLMVVHAPTAEAQRTDAARADSADTSRPATVRRLPRRGTDQRDSLDAERLRVRVAAGDTAAATQLEGLRAHRDRMARYEAERLNSARADDAARAERLRRLARRYPAATVEMVRARRIAVGWKPELVRESWGEPSDIRRTVTRTFTVEWWTYGERSIVQFENGRVAAIHQ